MGIPLVLTLLTAVNRVVFMDRTKNIAHRRFIVILKQTLLSIILLPYIAIEIG